MRSDSTTSSSPPAGGRCIRHRLGLSIEVGSALIVTGCGEHRSAVCTVEYTGIAVDILHTPRWPYPVRRTTLHWDVTDETSHSVTDSHTILVLDIHAAVITERGYLAGDAGCIQLHGKTLTMIAKIEGSDDVARGLPMNGDYPLKVRKVAAAPSQ